jgi:hypothetical protein
VPSQRAKARPTQQNPSPARLSAPEFAQRHEQQSDQRACVPTTVPSDRTHAMEIPTPFTCVDRAQVRCGTQRHHVHAQRRLCQVPVPTLALTAFPMSIVVVCQRMPPNHTPGAEAATTGSHRPPTCSATCPLALPTTYHLHDLKVQRSARHRPLGP